MSSPMLAVGDIEADLSEENRTVSGRLIIASDRFRRESAAEETTSEVPSA